MPLVDSCLLISTDGTLMVFNGFRLDGTVATGILIKAFFCVKYDVNFIRSLDSVKWAIGKLLTQLK